MKAPDLAHLFMQAPVAICIVSGPQYVVELVNERMLQFLGRTDAIVGRPLQATLTEAKEQGLLRILDSVRTTGEPFYTQNFPAVILIDGKREPRYFNLVFKPYYITPDETKPSGIFCVAHHVTEAVLARQKLEEEKMHTVLALETGELGMLSTNWTDKTVIADRRALEIFGFSEMQPVEAFMSRVHPEDLPIREKALQESITTGIFEFEVRLNIPGKNVRWIRSRGTLNKNAEGIATGSFGVVQDVTAQKEYALHLQQQVAERTAELEITNNTLQQLNADLLRSNAALEEFARAASHDMKEPVRKIQVFASRLRQTLDNRLTEDEKMIFGRMENAAGRMALLVDDLLEYSHLNHTPAAPETIDLNEKIARILSDLELLLSEKDVSIEMDNLPTVKGHRLQLQQLFQNLLTNAVKYSQPGVPPRIRLQADVVGTEALPVTLEQIAAHTHYHRIRITDNGIGFYPEEADKIFGVFTRLHGKEKYAGTGIGLSIAKKVAENHGGFIYAEGKPGEGATFTVLLPVK
ncbi:MAG TPA: ATP-binding protein [Flavisolibacter sp.]